MVEFAARCRGATKARNVNWDELGRMVAFGVGFGEDGVSVIPFHGANIRWDGANGDLACHGVCKAEIGGSSLVDMLMHNSHGVESNGRMPMESIRLYA